MTDPTDAIVVGVDDSAPSRAALRWAADYARATGGRLQVVHVLVWPPSSDIYAYSVRADEVYPDLNYVEEVHRASRQAMFDEVDPSPDWSLQVAQGHPGRILVELSRTARMLVVGAREHRGFDRLLNGSTGHYCLSHSACPIVSVPADRSTPDTTFQMDESVGQA